MGHKVLSTEGRQQKSHCRSLLAKKALVQELREVKKRESKSQQAESTRESTLRMVVSLKKA